MRLVTNLITVRESSLWLSTAMVAYPSTRPHIPGHVAPHVNCVQPRTVGVCHMSECIYLGYHL